MTCPCKDCTPETGRTPTCHASCKKYLHWRRVKDLRKQRKDREAAANNAIDALIYEKSEKKRRK